MLSDYKDASSDQRMSSHQGVPLRQVALYLFISSMNKLTKFSMTLYNVPNTNLKINMEYW